MLLFYFYVSIQQMTGTMKQGWIVVIENYRVHVCVS